MIRGSFAREKHERPGAARSQVRRLRLRLLHIYRRRFGDDECWLAESTKRSAGRSGWLPNGYAFWRDRIFRGPHTSLRRTALPDNSEATDFLQRVQGQAAKGHPDHTPERG